jgi:hypothetical protein
MDVTRLLVTGLRVARILEMHLDASREVGNFRNELVSSCDVLRNLKEESETGSFGNRTGNSEPVFHFQTIN